MLTAGFAALLTASLQGPAAGGTLEDILAEVYRTNPTIDAARGRLRETNERVPQAKAGWQPTVTIDASAGRRTVGTDDPLGRDGTSSPSSSALTIPQPIYRGGRTFAEVDRAQRQVEAGRARVAATPQQVLARAVRAHADVRRDRRILDFTQRNVEILRELVTATEDRQAEGFVTSTDLAEARTRLSGGIARRDNAQGQRESSRARFQEAVGRIPPCRLAPIQPPDNLPASADAAVQLAVDNPSLRRAKLEAAAAQNAVRVAEGDLLPGLSLRGDLRLQDDLDRDNARQDSAEVLLSLSTPFTRRARCIAGSARRNNARAGSGSKRLRPIARSGNGPARPWPTTRARVRAAAP